MSPPPCSLLAGPNYIQRVSAKSKIKGTARTLPEATTVGRCGGARMDSHLAIFDVHIPSLCSCSHRDRLPKGVRLYNSCF
ncbi:hypothetical protein VUR80DRAFT_4285 [Thermomyces stellatus]